MSNRGNGLTIFALLIGIGGLGIGVYSLFFLTPMNIQQASGNNEVTQIWTVEQDGSFVPVATFGDITGMTLTISVNPGETVYVLFNAEISNDDVGSGWLKGGIQITRDGVLIAKSNREFMIEAPIGSSIENSITTHFILQNLAAGTYEFQVQAKAQSQGGPVVVEKGLLMIYTYR